ncbi:hypothetical protein AGMMS49546_37100 [Spirochaetia bacterium]|nr:hypothetical protein AGMMS49546_37100 [Spirochaetia bacterium]
MNKWLIISLLLALPLSLHAQAAPGWVQNLEQAYPYFWNNPALRG